MIREESRFSWWVLPGRGRLEWRTWYSMLKRSSSTQTGRCVNGIQAIR